MEQNEAYRKRKASRQASIVNKKTNVMQELVKTIHIKGKGMVCSLTTDK
jgi:hypothetical protein